MTAVTAARAATGSDTGAIWVLRDAWVMVRRIVMHTFRQPDLLVFSTIQPVMFVLLFRTVFSGIPTGIPYVQFLIPGILVQTTVFGSMLTGLGLCFDLQKGIVDRFRSLPMSRSAVLVGRTVADALRNLFVLLLMLAVGVLVGFRTTGGFLGTVAGLGIVLLFGFAFSWISAFIALLIKNPEAMQSVGFIWVFPVTFLSSAFVATATISPHWLGTVADVNPFSIAVNATRQLMLGPALSQQAGLSADATAHVLQTLAWTAGLLVVFIALSVQRYRRTV